MALRILELVVPAAREQELLQTINRDDFPQIVELWTHPASENRSCVKVVVEAESTEALTDAIGRVCADNESYRLVLLPVEATLPPVEEPAPVEVLADEKDDSKRVGRVSREELLADLSDTARLSRTFVVLSILSTVVAVIGLTRSNVAIIIGAMVIAPFLGSNVALSLATTLADGSLARRALQAFVSGLLIALGVAVVAGLIMRPSPTVPEIASRTTAGWGDIALAVASGAAGSLAYTTAVPTALVGVMVSVALLPPWVTFGMLLGSGHWVAALGALLLTGMNVICLNLAGVLTFLLQGVRPGSWWEAKKARRMSFIALSVWIGLLTVLIVLLLTARVH
ncbi:TIGR00341 family protein [Candidatus Bipolaricaulota bacterium]|nr:TIGR00341 family protein [Candidatus Bipolaricaulota bacterium]